MAAENASASKLAELFSYDAGALFWKIPPNRKLKAGARAGSLDKKTGYRRVKVGGVDYMEHRVIWQLLTGAPPAGQIDHLNGDKTDNRIENMRDVPAHFNCQNRVDLRSDNKSGVAGVSWNSKTGMWVAQISVRKNYTTTHKTLAEAKEARAEMVRRHHPGRVRD